MKYFRNLSIALLTISLFFLLLSGCNVAGSKYSNNNKSKYNDDEKAALVGEAVTESGLSADQSKSITFKTITTINDNSGGTLEYNDSASKDDLSASAYYSDMDSWTSPPATYNSLTYKNFHVTVQDSNGTDVVVTLTGSVTWGYNFTVTDTGSVNGTMIFYGTTSGTIYGEEYDSFIIDLKYTYSYDSDNSTFTGTITGTVDGRKVENSFNYITPPVTS